MEARLAIEETWPGDAESPLVGRYRKEEVRAAFEEFQDPRRRLVDELLWRWGEADLGCGCPRSVHDDHDEVVRLHAKALEVEAGRLTVPAKELGALWRGAASGWGTLLARAEFREHVTHRMRALNDPRLGEHTTDDFLAGLPKLLVSPLLELAMEPAFGERLADVSEEWARIAVFSTHISELFEETLEERTEKIRDGLLAAEGMQEARRYADAAEILRQRVVPEFEQLDVLRAFLPEWRHEQIAHAVAVTLNNLAVALQHYHLNIRPTAEQRDTMLGLVEKAHDFAPKRDEGHIFRNWAAIREQFGSPGRVRGRPVPEVSTNRRRDTIGCVLFLLGIAAVLVLAAVVGPAPAIIAGFGAFVVIGYISHLLELSGHEGA
ncbi:hypothetical protein [Streptomyces litchfieldiae]|uniref:Uncharacterized protein n=1 Tax=Streptomyces litchfieldiae TaxID=3075543 RepID=A0ABU2MTU0_9ACTN|nr:hypothetical protein [Streptomyces sp. DSM 44938]MDT0344955.1 hypothetical protein [Streptomyces sp. DSM 44938]